MDDYYTISELATLFNINKSTLYKYIRCGKITCHTCIIKGKTVKKISKSALERFLKDYINYQPQQETHDQPQENIINNYQPHPAAHDETQSKNIRNVLEQFFTEKETQLMKPLEEQALYIAWSVNKRKPIP